MSDALALLELDRWFDEALAHKQALQDDGQVILLLNH